MFRHFALLLVCLFGLQPVFLSGAEEENKIVYLISGPRALSTVFLRMMESRGDFSIFHEPTIPLFDRVHYPELTGEWFKEDAFKSFEEVKEKIYASLKHSNVFVKEMSFSSKEFILNDPPFMKDPTIHFVFLVRDPHHSSISFYRKSGYLTGISDLIGLKKLYEEYQAIREHNPNGVKIIFSEQLYLAPRSTMSKLCAHLKIPFSEKVGGPWNCWTPRRWYTYAASGP